jgi:hypothetical protein
MCPVLISDNSSEPAVSKILRRTPRKTADDGRALEHENRLHPPPCGRDAARLTLPFLDTASVRNLTEYSVFRRYLDSVISYLRFLDFVTAQAACPRGDISRILSFEFYDINILPREEGVSWHVSSCRLSLSGRQLLSCTTDLLP